MLKSMIIPLLKEQLLQMIVGLVDTMIVSHAGEAKEQNHDEVQRQYLLMLLSFAKNEQFTENII